MAKKLRWRSTSLLLTCLLQYQLLSPYCNIFTMEHNAKKWNGGGVGRGWPGLSQEYYTLEVFSGSFVLNKWSRGIS